MAEVDWAKEMADRLSRVNQQLSKENVELKAQFKAGEEDRNFLIKQLVAIKKDNARLLQELERVDAELLEHQEQKKKKKKEGDGVTRRVSDAGLRSVTRAGVANLPRTIWSPTLSSDDSPTFGGQIRG